MVTSAINFMFSFFSFFWLTGPVFEKELRVSSRQRRNFFLRFAYIILLLIIMLFIWTAAFDSRGSNLWNISRLAEAGRRIVTYIVWFQFCAAQIIAIVMLSNSISDEIYHKTLGTLMTTPITSTQIVVGKLLSKILQLVLLLAISLPLLSIIRIFGGVSWSFIISSLALTLSTVLLLGMISLFYSILCRKAYVVIIFTVITVLAVYALLPFLYVSFVEITDLNTRISGRTLETVLILPSPYITFFFNAYTNSHPGNSGINFSSITLYINCAINLAISLVLLVVSIIMVRRVALRQAVGQLYSSRPKKSRKKNAHGSENSSERIISVIGPPVFWKELILPLRKRSKILRILGMIIFMILLFYSYWYFFMERSFQHGDIHIFYVLIFMLLGTLFSLVYSCVCINSEKESRSWHLLLTSTLTDSQIIIGKLYGVLSRCLPIWFLLLGHILFCYITGVIHSVAILLVLILLVWYVFFLSSTGIYFSSVFKHSTTAVVANFILIAISWVVIPFLMILMNVRSRDDPIDAYISSNPFIQGIVIVISTVGLNMNKGAMDLNFDWPMGHKSYNETLFIFCISFMVYSAISLFLLWRARKRVRRKIF